MSSNSHPIRLRGVRVHNLKGIDLDLPTGRLVVITGVSGSGKSSLAFDTLYAEGQRRFIETFSADARRFLEKLDKPDADRIDDIPPALAVAQRGAKRSGRSTVGTITELQADLALLFARVGVVRCLNCGAEVRPSGPEDVARAIDGLPEKTRYLVAFPMEIGPESDRAALADALREDGFVRVRVDGQVVPLEAGPLLMPADGVVEVVVDRLVRGSEDPARRTDSIETAFAKGLGRCRVIAEGSETLTFYRGWRCSRCGATAKEPEPGLFLFNNPIGACPACEGFGRVIDLDLDRIVPDKNKSLRDGAVVPWTTPSHRPWLDDLLRVAPTLGIAVDLPFKRLPAEQVTMLVDGVPGRGWPGLRGFFKGLEARAYKMHVRVFLSRWRGYEPCPTCGGTRLRPEALAVRVGGRSIAELASATIADTLRDLRAYDETEGRSPVARRVLEPALRRLELLDRIGLGYLTLDRPARALSAGEARRVALATALGSGLVRTLYVLDEPSVGLHPRDVGRLKTALEGLRDAGNSVVVVEHDLALIQAADWLVDIGPGAGESGGRVLYAGPPEGVADVPESATGAFVGGRRRMHVPSRRRQPEQGAIVLRGASGHNLKNMEVSFPLGLLCVVSGVSGAGKSTLVEETLYPALLRRLKNEYIPGEPFRELAGTAGVDDVVLVDQSPIGRSGRSNPVTYLKAFDEVRKTFAATHEAKLRNFGPSKFSFNVPGGRCDACEGNGSLTIDMQFLPDVLVRCPECRGTRYRAETLEVTYRGKNIAEVLDLTAREAFGFFRNRPKVQARLRPLLDVGLDYLRLGQPAPTLSGGEAQRLKLASYLATSPAALARMGDRPKTLFLLDEPTTGLHPADVLRLLDVLNALVDQGHSLIVVEHNLDVLAAADWLIDLGPDAGPDGGLVVAEGTPEAVARSGTFTGAALAEVFDLS
jgi:excinuclease ABC subunit A